LPVTSWPGAYRLQACRARSGKRKCQPATARAPEATARSWGSKKETKQKRCRQGRARGWTSWGHAPRKFLVGKSVLPMLAPRRKRQKPCRASSFQNAEQGFDFEPDWDGYVCGLLAAAEGAAGPEPVPASFGVER